MSSNKSISMSCQNAIERIMNSPDPLVLSCDHSPEGVLSAIGLAYLAKATRRDLRLSGAKSPQLRLGESSIEIEPDLTLARRVNVGLNRAMSRNGTIKPRNPVLGGRTVVEWARANSALYACCCDDEDMPQTVFDFARLAFSKPSTTYHLESHPSVVRYRELVGFASGELEHVKQFTRFSHMADGSYFATFSPAANVVPLSLSTFAARLGEERFCLLDPVHLVALLYDGTGEARSAQAEALVWDANATRDGRPQGARAVIKLSREDAQIIARRNDFAPGEQYIRSLWKHFYDALELPGRGPEERGYDLRAHWEPKRFWTNLPEMDPRNDDPGDEVPEKYRGGTS